MQVSVRGPDEARNRDSYCDNARPHLQAGQHRPHEAIEILDSLLGRSIEQRSVATGRGHNLATQPHDCSPNPVRGDVDGKSARTVLAQLHYGRRTSRRPRDYPGSAPLPDNATGHEFRYQGGDRAPIKAEPLSQLGPGQGPADVQFP